MCEYYEEVRILWDVTIKLSRCTMYDVPYQICTYSSSSEQHVYRVSVQLDLSGALSSQLFLSSAHV